MFVDEVLKREPFKADGPHLNGGASSNDTKTERLTTTVRWGHCGHYWEFKSYYICYLIRWSLRFYTVLPKEIE